MVHDGIIQLQKIRGLTEIKIHGGETVDQDIQSLQEQFTAYLSIPQWQSYSSLFGVGNEVAKVQNNAAKILSMPADAGVEGHHFHQHTRIIIDMYRIIRLIADRSHLRQDEDFETYYLVNLIVNELPELIEYIGETRGIGGGILASGTITEDERELFNKHLTACNLAFKRMEEDVRLTLMTVPQLEEVITPIVNKVEMGLQHFSDESQKILAGDLNQFTAKHYFHNGTLAIDAFHGSHGKIMHLLRTRMEERLKSQRSLRFHTITLASLGAALIIYFINSFYRTNRAAFRTIEHLSISDHLTDLYNRRHLHQILPQELRRNRREGKSLSFGILDVDHFKAYNDIYGHPDGDIILKKVADTLKETLRRASDFVFRIGGEEFCFILTDMQEDEVKLILDQIRVRIMAMEITHEGNEAAPFVTASIGAVYLEIIADETMDEIIRCADFALYAAKDMGRNCWHLENILTAPCEDFNEESAHNWQI
jgi:diguanylate cyclase (GGDEF)-like protein